MTSRGVITAIQQQKAHPDRVSLFVNDEYVLGIRRELAYQLQLKVGLQVSEEDIANWQAEEDSLSARDLAVKYITQRSRTKHQIADYLLRKGFEPTVAEQAVNYLEKMGYVNDESYATAFVKSRIQSKPRGKRMVKWELQQKGIDKHIVDEALLGYEDEIEVANRLLTKKISSIRIQNTEDLKKEEAKIVRFLARKGFSSTTIQALIKQIKNLWQNER